MGQPALSQNYLKKILKLTVSKTNAKIKFDPNGTLWSVRKLKLQEKKTGEKIATTSA